MLPRLHRDLTAPTSEVKGASGYGDAYRLSEPCGRFANSRATRTITGNDAMRWVISMFLAVAALTGITAFAMTGGSVASGFHGAWVPGPAACSSPLKLVIEANVVTFVNGTQHAEYRQLEQCFTCMGRDVGNVTLLSTDAMGESPFLIYLDASKKRVPYGSISAMAKHSGLASRSARLR
jgi:hypothetical protein